MALTTLANLEERLAITGTNPTDTPDAYLNNLISRAAAKVESIIGREVEDATYTEYCDGDGTRFLNLRRGPIVSVTSVSTIVYDSAANETATALNAGDYFIRGNVTDQANWKLPGYIESHSSVFTRGQRNYKVIYVGGYTTVPSDIEEATLFACVWMHNKRRDASTGARDIGGGSLGGFRDEDELERSLHSMLRPYIPLVAC